MGIRIIVIAVLGVLVIAPSSSRAAAAQSGLKDRYDAAQHFQQAGKMKQAAAEYRAFIAEAAGELVARV